MTALFSRKQGDGVTDYERARHGMVETQLRARGIADERVLDAMGRVPREMFIPESARSHAYEDRAVRIESGQTISQPYMVALMTELLAPGPGDRVLEIGTGSGYQTAVLALLAEHVVSIERHAALAESARAVLDEVGIKNVEVIVGDGTLGCPERGPYDGILVTAAGPEIPPSLGEQLAMGGRLICPFGPRDVQELHRIVNTPKGLMQERSIRCAFVPLIGEEGWEEDAT